MDRKIASPLLSSRRVLSPVLLGIATALTVTAVLYGLRELVTEAHTALFFELGVVIAAVAGGTQAALAAAALSFVAWDFFFLPPVFTFTIQDPRNVLLLLVFLVVALIVGKLAGELKQREEEASLREREVRALYRSSMAVAAETDERQACVFLARHIMESSGAAGCLISAAAAAGSEQVLAQSGVVDGFLTDEGKTLAAKAAASAKSIIQRGADDVGRPPEPAVVTSLILVAEASEVFVPLAAGDRILGVLYAAAPHAQPFQRPQLHLLEAFANHVAAVLERSRLMKKAADLAAVKEKEQLRSVLFSSLSHNLKTPLASLTATVSNLRQQDVAWTAQELRDGLEFIESDVVRLTEHIDKLLDLAQLESGTRTLRREWYEFAEVIASAARAFRKPDDKRIRVEEGSAPGECYVDLVQISQVLRHLLENALDYSPAGSEVGIGYCARPDGLEFWVDDAGPGVPLADRQKVFEKFYRGDAALRMSVRGTGLGLSICREIVHSHGGDILIEDSPLGGARFRVRIPRQGVSGAERV